jgi:hypothetical protein
MYAERRLCVKRHSTDAWTASSPQRGALPSSNRHPSPGRSGRNGCGVRVWDPLPAHRPSFITRSPHSRHTCRYSACFESSSVRDETRMLRI